MACGAYVSNAGGTRLTVRVAAEATLRKYAPGDRSAPTHVGGHAIVGQSARRPKRLRPKTYWVDPWRCRQLRPRASWDCHLALLPLPAGMCLASRILAATSSVRKRQVDSEASLRINAKLRQERHGTRRQILSAGIMPLLTELEKRSKRAFDRHAAPDGALRRRNKQIRTGKSCEPAGWKTCATGAKQPSPPKEREIESSAGGSVRTRPLRRAEPGA